MLRKTAAGTYVGPWIQAPGDVFADLAAAVAEGADCVDRAAQLWTDREQACSRSRRLSLPSTTRSSVAMSAARSDAFLTAAV